MARSIANTPELKGKDALDFRSKLFHSLTRQLTKEEKNRLREEKDRMREAYEMMRKLSNGECA